MSTASQAEPKREMNDPVESTAETTKELRTKVAELSASMNNVLVGQERAVSLAIIALLAGGHALVEDVPGVGKTLLAKTLATSIDADFKRIQCTPDLLPSDISGVNIYQQKEGIFSFQPGPIFSNILLTDEINRATPRTQSSLLEAMEEYQVTTDGVTRKLPELFFVIATENPIEYHGTFPLPEAQLDRFMLCLSLGYPDPAQEMEILNKTLTKDGFRAKHILTVNEVVAAQKAVRETFVDNAVKSYIVDIVQKTRKHSLIVLGISPRGAQLMMRAAQAKAFMDNRDFVKPEDVKELAPFVLGHRVIPKVQDNRVSHGELIKQILTEISVPV